MKGLKLSHHQGLFVVLLSAYGTGYQNGGLSVLHGYLFIYLFIYASGKRVQLPLPRGFYGKTGLSDYRSATQRVATTTKAD